MKRNEIRDLFKVRHEPKDFNRRFSSYVVFLQTQVLFKFYNLLVRLEQLENVCFGNRHQLRFFLHSADQSKKRHNDSQFSVIFSQFPVSFFHKLEWMKNEPGENINFEGPDGGEDDENAWNLLMISKQQKILSIDYIGRFRRQTSEQ